MPVEVDRVAHSYSEMASALERVSQQLNLLGLSDPGSWIDVAHNRIELRVLIPPTMVAHSLGVADGSGKLEAKRTAARIVEAAGGGINLSFVRSPPRPAACDPDYQECDHPLRGGIYIPKGDWYGASFTCTASFNVTGNNTGNSYVMTAGHCYSRNTPGLSPDVLINQYHTRMPLDGLPHLIGERVNSEYGPTDEAVVSVDNLAGWFKPGEARNAILVTDCPVNNTKCLGHPTTRDTAYAITSVSTTGPLTPHSSYLCATGAMTGTRCGQYQGDNINGADGVVNLAKISLFTCPGDSGGPIFISHTAYGITSQISDWGRFADERGVGVPGA